VAFIESKRENMDIKKIMATILIILIVFTAFSITAVLGNFNQFGLYSLTLSIIATLIFAIIYYDAIWKTSNEAKNDCNKSFERSNNKIP